MFTIADHQLLATLIIEIDDLETGIEDTNVMLEYSLLQKCDTIEKQNEFLTLHRRKSAYISAKNTYTKKLNELEQKAFADNYNPYLS